MRPVLQKAAEKDGHRETIKQEPRSHACLAAERWQFGVFRLKVVFAIPEEVDAMSERRQKRPKNFKLS